MAVVVVDFTHFDRTFTAGDVLDDTDPLVVAAPHLFVQPDPPLISEPDPELRIRGPLVQETPKRKR